LSKTPRLHIPQRSSRPGEEPNFSYVELSEAGDVARPSTDTPSREIENLALSLVRVLDDEHQARGPWDPKLTNKQLQHALTCMLKTRIYDARMLRMHRQGKISFYMQSLGEEAVSVAQCMALQPEDMLFPSYRNQGLHITRGRDVVDLMNQCLSNQMDSCKGRQMPIMYHWKDGNIFSISGNLTTQVPQAVGWAMASALKGEHPIAATWVGDGSTAEADFYHALTFASVYKAPVILNVVNNQWAISTFQAFAGGGHRPFAARGLGFGIPGVRVDGNDVLAVYAVTRWAAERARSGVGPTLIELVTYRAGAHSTSDDPSRYRPKDEWKQWPLGDPIERLKNHMIDKGNWTEKKHASVIKKLEAEVAQSWKQAETNGSLAHGPRLHEDSMFEDVYKTVPKHLQKQREELKSIKNRGVSS